MKIESHWSQFLEMKAKTCVIVQMSLCEKVIVQQRCTNLLPVHHADWLTNVRYK